MKLNWPQRFKHNLKNIIYIHFSKLNGDFMKKIGILFGKERSFPEAFVDRVNQKKVDGISAEPVHIDKVMQGESSGYAVIFDRISQDIPFYRAFLKNAALCGTAVINNPFWWSADEKFFNNSLATKIRSEERRVGKEGRSR